MPIQILINDDYELTEVFNTDETRLLEIAKQPNFLCAPLNARLDGNGKKISLEQCVKDFIAGSVFGVDEQSFGGVLAIRERASAKCLMGAIGITSVTEAEAELGYFLAPELHGKRVIMPALYCALRYASGHWGVKRLRAEVDPENTVSLHILKNLGFEVSRPSAISQKYCDLSGTPAMRQHMHVGEEALKKRLGSL